MISIKRSTLVLILLISMLLLGGCAHLFGNAEGQSVEAECGAETSEEYRHISADIAKSGRTFPCGTVVEVCPGLKVPLPCQGEDRSGGILGLFKDLVGIR